MEDFEDFDFELNEDEQIPKRVDRPVFRYIKVIVAVLVIIGLLNIFGFRNIFFYRITPFAVQQDEVDVKIDSEILQVPLNIIVLTTAEEGHGSKRDRDSVINIVKKADTIWGQARIRLVIKDINFEPSSDELLGKIYSNPGLVLGSLKNLDPLDRSAGNKSINVIFVGSLGRINGVYFGGLNTVAVADYTTVYDFRVLAHEIGHALGLPHVSESRGQLMYRGANGFNITIEEINTARINAKI